MALDNYVNMEKGGEDFKWDNELINFCVDNLDSVDTLLLGRKTSQDLIPFWDDVATKPGHKDFNLGKRISELQKVVLSKTMTDLPFKRTTVINGDIKTEVTKLKKSDGKDILVYGGASFAASLIENKLVDEFYFFLNPFRLGDGVTIFKPNNTVQTFTLISSKSFPCGVVMVSYKPNYK